MGRNRVAAQEVDRIPLSDGDWVELKRDLNAGDLKKLEDAGLAPPVRLADGSITRPIDWERYEFERAAIFLVDWSFRGPDDKPLALKGANGQVSIATLKVLDIESFDEINAAVFRHTTERAAAKNRERDAKREMETKTIPPQGTEPVSEAS